MPIEEPSKLGNGIEVADPKLQIDERCDRIEAALGTLADNLGEGQVVRAILYGGKEPGGKGVDVDDSGRIGTSPQNSASLS